MFPEVGNVVVCDTSFHYNMPKKAYTYALPRDVVEKLHIRKYRLMARLTAIFGVW